MESAAASEKSLIGFKIKEQKKPNGDEEVTRYSITLPYPVPLYLLN